MYFVHFNIHSTAKAITNITDDVALLINEVQLPKFKISTETVNQYNRKTNVQTKLSYEPISFTFHDDVNSETSGFWTNYYQYFYQDSNYSSSGLRVGFSDTKYGINDNQYGFNPHGTRSTPYFLESIDIYLLNSQRYQKITIINPLITAWDHDTVSQKEGNKILTNKMTVVYEDVVYSNGSIGKPEPGDEQVTLFENPDVYDKTPSPLESNYPAYASTLTNTPRFFTGNNGINTSTNIVYGKINNTKTYLPGDMPTVSTQLKNSLSIGQIINDINTIKAFKQNPRQMLNVYGLNIKNLLINSALGAINSSAANVVGSSGIPQQGTLASNTYTVSTFNINQL
jgi:hypothetical protein